MTRAERKIANALQRVVNAIDEYAIDRLIDGDQETRQSARKVDRAVAKAKTVLRAIDSAAKAE